MAAEVGDGQVLPRTAAPVLTVELAESLVRTAPDLSIRALEDTPDIGPDGFVPGIIPCPSRFAVPSNPASKFSVSNPKTSVRSGTERPDLVVEQPLCVLCPVAGPGPLIQCFLRVRRGPETE